LAVPVLLTPTAVFAPEVLASPPGEGLLLAPVVPWFMVPVPSFIAPCDAPGPTLPWLDAPSKGLVVCAPAGEARAKMQAEAKMMFSIWLLGVLFVCAHEKQVRNAFVLTSDSPVHPPCMTTITR
jgi:hypothetical protein